VHDESTVRIQGMASITVDRISKRFGDVFALHELSLAIADGEFIALLGPSGCGKSTLLRVIAGLESPDTGCVSIDGRDVTRIDPSLRDLAFVFQSYALYPHKSVLENIIFPLRMRGSWPARLPLFGRAWPPARRAEARWIRSAREVAAPLELDGLLARKPAELSGGQRQRVALARALIRRPVGFLLDEPLSNLDARLRAGMRTTLVELHRRLRSTFVYVTHDQSEAMSMADRVVLMRDGGVEQIGAPLALYDNPATRFVAGFMGSPAINVLPFACSHDGHGTLAGVPAAATPPCVDGVPTPGLRADLGCRPHDITVSTDADATLRATVLLTEPQGDAAFVTLSTGAAGILSPRLVVRVSTGDARRIAPGDTMPLRIDWTRALLFGSDGRRVRAGNRMPA
jgi:multiple sugar transport system ATP-binding protein